ncbi:MAG: hypothetical protein KGZ58_11355 [Ignavibacteriales bacterium]|nr:hypothetical protein [Ignavibacteriales bacterium]
MSRKAAKTQTKKIYSTKKSVLKVKEPTLNVFYLPHTKSVGAIIDQMNQKNVLTRSSDSDSQPFLKELGIQIEEHRQSIQFTPNEKEIVHRWTPYIQGFSASFVQRQIDIHKQEYNLTSGKHWILDPFAGSGTVMIQSKFNGIPSVGTELNPLLHFTGQVKGNCWNLSGVKLLEIANVLVDNKYEQAPEFLESTDHFNAKVLRELERIRGGIKHLETIASLLNGHHTNETVSYIDLLKLAFSSILVECSNLKRSPCLGYDSKKVVSEDTPQKLFQAKITQIAHDLDLIRINYPKQIETTCETVLANSMEFEHSQKFALAITSPPYMNGLDYVINYKIEMAWLDFIKNHSEAKAIKDEMVVCDNVSKGLTRQFAKEKNKYQDDWLELIVYKIEENIGERGKYRRLDMPFIVHKYFDDMYKVFQKVIPTIESGGRFILVVGDSLITDVYLPTDLLLARMGTKLGMEIEQIQLARNRRSGQVRTYKLRETIITLRKK